ncbi:MAG: tRNA (adenosine(37)-N6)-threonylcarbamoyltransferase complex dimerization subunit type 1 TsaB [Anaerolineales bacterium]
MLLAIDTSTAWISLALHDGAFVRYEITWESQHHHTVELAPALAQLFEHTGTKPTDLTGLAVALGPGSYTSLRIGLAAVKGLALGLNLPVVGVPSLDVIASAQLLEDKPLIAVLHAGRTRLAYVRYQAVNGRWKAQGEALISDPQDLVKAISEPTLICGELSEEDRVIIGRRWKNAIIAPPSQCLRRASFLAEIGWDRLLNGQSDDLVNLVPIYLSTSSSIPA